jgi:hypothetical protein
VSSSAPSSAGSLLRSGSDGHASGSRASPDAVICRIPSRLSQLTCNGWTRPDGRRRDA